MRAVCDPDALGFETTLDVSPLKEKVVAQDRAVHALEFGLGVKDLEYNIFVAGPPRAGKTETIMAYVQELAATEPTPPDYIYVHNFKEPEQPQSLSLPTGKGRLLKADMEVLISNLKMQIPEVFESEDYSGRREALMHGFAQERNKILQELDGKAGEQGFILNISPTGLMIFPGKEGKPLGEEELKALNDEDREALRQKSAQLHTEMNEAIRKIRKMEKEFQEQEKKLDQDVALYVVGHHMEELREKYQDLPQVLDYLKDVQEDILKNIDDLKRRPSCPGPLSLSRAGAVVCAIPGERLRGPLRNQRRPGDHGEQPHLPQPVRGGGTPGPVRRPGDRLQPDPGRSLAAGQRRLPHPGGPGPAALVLFV